MLAGVRTEERYRIDEGREEAQADANKAGAKIDDWKACVAGINASMVRIEVLLEEQKAQTLTMQEGITALLSRQNQVEQRVTEVEDTVRKLATGRR